MSFFIRWDPCIVRRDWRPPCSAGTWTCRLFFKYILWQSRRSLDHFQWITERKIKRKYIILTEQTGAWKPNAHCPCAGCISQPNYPLGFVLRSAPSVDHTDESNSCCVSFRMQTRLFQAWRQRWQAAKAQSDRPATVERHISIWASEHDHKQQNVVVPFFFSFFAKCLPKFSAKTQLCYKKKKEKKRT